jgi:hypothetical protein
MLKDTQFDYIQPDHPLFEEIYKYNPSVMEKKKSDDRMRQKERMKDDREIWLKVKVRQGRLKPWELKEVKSIAKDRGLD